MTRTQHDEKQDDLLNKISLEIHELKTSIHGNGALLGVTARITQLKDKMEKFELTAEKQRNTMYKLLILSITCSALSGGEAVMDILKKILTIL